MELKFKLKIAVAAACLAAAISVLVTTRYLKPRKRKQFLTNLSSCYLKTEEKPQHLFKRVLADNSYTPFKHLKLTDSNEICSNLHPYKSEITALLKNSELELEFIGDGHTLSELKDSYVWVDTESKLKELADVLSKEKIFGVDTEQHSLHSFLGFTALIQISTQSEDYLVDTIALHDVMSILRPIFANPGICKVFHGADNDVLWLQRDFHIYVVNLFDTAKGCEVLTKPQKSLAYLLETYCGVATNKLLQKEDWRQRPLPLEMVQYARIDAHYLLYIAKCLVSELKKCDVEISGSENSACLDDKFHFVLEARRRSNATCLQLFAKEIEGCPGESAASSIINRHLNDGILTSVSPHVKFQDFVRQLCTWRDLMARVHDESLKCVLSDYAIVALATDAPTAEIDIHNCILQADLTADPQNVNSMFHSPSAVVRSHIEDLTYFFKNDTGKPDDIFHVILQKRLGTNGSCPLSVYNYTLLTKNNLKLTNRLVSKGNKYNNSKQVSRKTSRELFVQKFSCKSPVYHNCRIYANDGRLLCYCDRRKVDWYLQRDLAKLVDDDPLAITLLFEPKGRPEDEDNDFYIQSKKNICVGCGEGKHYLRYRVIPSCYRAHFPEHLKSHRSHDIVLLCVDCHEIAHSAAERHKRIVAAEFGIPLFIQKIIDPSQAQDRSGSSGSTVHLVNEGVSPLELRTAAMALLRHGPRMPAKRHEELTQTIMKYYGGREISDEDLERALVVGMTPHERRRAARKWGLSFKHVLASNEPECSGNGPIPIPEDTIETNGLNGSHAHGMVTGCDNGGVLPTETGVSTISIVPEVCGEGFIPDSECTESNEKILPETCSASEVSVIDADSSLECNGHSNSTVSSKGTSRMSQLGHGPHGYQVVSHLLKEYGDDGIAEFCQRWRQVFVDAINPRFLPAGWDVTHSGRREFGEFSVYKPTKKSSATSNIS